MKRRTLLKAPVVLGTGALLAGCGAPVPRRSAHDDAEHPRPGAEHPSASTSRALLAYFSRAGENYHHGDTRVLEVGNTEVLAGKISAQRHRRLNHVQAEDHTTVPRLLTERRDDLVAERTRTLHRLGIQLRDLHPGGADRGLSTQARRGGAVRPMTPADTPAQAPET